MNCIAYEKQGIDNTTGMDDLFDQDKDKVLQYGITLTPAVVINGQPYRDDLDGELIFRQICQAFEPGKAPEVCNEDYDLAPELGQLSDFKEIYGSSLHFAVFIILGIFFCNILAIMYLTKRQEKDDKKLQDEVQQHVDKYFRL